MASQAQQRTGAAGATRLACPSAQPDMQDAHVFALLEGSAAAPRVAYLKKEALIPIHALPTLPEGLSPSEVFRMGARCEEHRCGQYADGRCSLGERVVRSLPAVVDRLPSCTLRDSCRWHAEQGGAACLRCPQVVTLVPRDTDPLARVAVPPAQRAGASPGAEAAIAR